MTQADFKEASPASTPTPAPTSGPPPYDPTPNEENDDATEPSAMFTRPGNNIIISRTFGALRGMRFIIDPSIHLPKTLLRPQPSQASQKPELNLELGVDFGGIDAEVDVLPLVTPTVTVRPEGDERSDEDETDRGVDARQQKKVHLSASTIFGHINLRVNAPPATPIVLNVNSDFGRIRVHLPRTMHGPLTLSSSIRTPRLSPALRSACMPLREVGNKTHWFVGDLGAWSAKDEIGDEVTLSSEFGIVWVGYIGEEDEIPRVRRGNAVWHGLRAMGMFLLPLAVYRILSDEDETSRGQRRETVWQGLRAVGIVLLPIAFYHILAST